MTLAELLRHHGSARPLVLQCGSKKLEGTHRVDALYTGSYWSTYRAAIRDRGRPFDRPVYVLSARYGLAPIDARIASYDAVLADRPRKPNEVAFASILPLLVRQRARVGDEVDMVGSALYAEALTQAGFSVHRLTPPGAGIGYMLQALRAHLLS